MNNLLRTIKRAWVGDHTQLAASRPMCGSWQANLRMDYVKYGNSSFPRPSDSRRVSHEPQQTLASQVQLFSVPSLAQPSGTEAHVATPSAMPGYGRVAAPSSSRRRSETNAAARVSSPATESTAAPVISSQLKGINNARDLSEALPGFAPGRIMRCAVPNKATRDDVELLFNDKAIRLLIDLRADEELKEDAASLLLGRTRLLQYQWPAGAVPASDNRASTSQDGRPITRLQVGDQGTALCLD